MSSDPNYTSVFISHSSKDAPYAKRVVDILLRTMKFNDYEIMCTSLANHSIVRGTSYEKSIQTAISNCDYFIALISKASLSSFFFSIECGAAWGTGKKPIAAVVLPGLETEQVPRPLQSLQIMEWSDLEHWMQLLQEISEETGSTPINKRVWKGRIEQIITEENP
nr:toll/interleukin-1 receptor domain-containing protein [uncultured Duganella sp.]